MRKVINSTTTIKTTTKLSGLNAARCKIYINEWMAWRGERNWGQRKRKKEIKREKKSKKVKEREIKIRW